MSTVVLISGASRGIGLGLLKRYLQLPNHTVIAANRSISNTTLLSQLPTAPGTKLIIVKIDATIWQDAFEAVNTLGHKEDIDHIDIVVANAGVCYTWPRVADAKREDIVAHMEPNGYGVVSLFQATRSLLQKSEREPVFAIMGTTAGSLTTLLPYPSACYGPSKAVSAWYSIRINMEEPWLHSFSLCPGWVHTEMGDAGAKDFGVNEAAQAQLMVSVEDTCAGMMKILAETSKEKHGGRLVEYTGKVLDW